MHGPWVNAILICHWRASVCVWQAGITFIALQRFRLGQLGMDEVGQPSADFMPAPVGTTAGAPGGYPISGQMDPQQQQQQQQMMAGGQVPYAASGPTATQPGAPMGGQYYGPTN